MNPLDLLSRNAGVLGTVGAVIGALAAGTAVGMAAEKAAVHGLPRRRGEPGKGEPAYGSLRGRVVDVVADDGTRLHVEIDGPDDPDGAGAGTTVVFSHGYANNSDAFHFQRRDLRRPGERFVFWDQRSHGRSARGKREAATIDQLGRDLWRVVQSTAPEGPLVLVGHSMGGMTVMALADQQPEIFGDRVIGVALLSTSAGQLANVGLGLPFLNNPLARRIKPGLIGALGRQHRLVERARRIGSDVGLLATRRFSFGSSVSPALVEFVAEMISATPIDVLAEFYSTLDEHEKVAALGALNRGVEVLVLAGDTDRMVPTAHSKEIVRYVPGAESVVIADAGHMVMLEHPDEVNGALRAFFDRVERAARVPRAVVAGLEFDERATA